MEDQIKIAHYHNLLKIIKYDKAYEERIYMLLHMYIDHAIEGNPLDELDELDYAEILSIIALNRVEQD